MNFFVPKEYVSENQIVIKGSDVNHIKNVLRHSIGDVLDIVSDNIKYSAKIIEINSDFVRCEIEEVHKEECANIKITVFQGLAKADKIEYIIQKCTELGVYEIAPVEMKRCVIKLDQNDKIKKINRWKKIAEVAAKQSLRNDILKVEKVYSFEDMESSLKNYDYVILAYEKEKDVTLKSFLKKINCDSCNIAVIIGPEGGLDESEVERLVGQGAISVTLGKRILRTETAPVAMSAIIMYELES